MKYLIFLICSLLSLPTLTLYAQKNPAPDTTKMVSDTLPKTGKKKPAPSAKRSSIIHARNAVLFGIIPGGGQIYNKSYWKLPIIYGGMAGLGYFVADSGIKYQGYRRAYREAVDDDTTTNYRSPFDPDESDPAKLKIQRDKFQNQFEYAAFGLTVFYGLVLMEAFVDAHFKDFNISDDLSMGIRPRLQYDGLNRSVMPSVRLTFRPRYPVWAHHQQAPQQPAW